MTRTLCAWCYRVTDLPSAPTCQSPHVKDAGEQYPSNDDEDKARSNSNNRSSSNNSSSSSGGGAKSTGEPSSGAADDADNFSSINSDKGGEDEGGAVHGNDVDEDEADSEAGVMEGVHPGLATYESQRAAVGGLGGGGGAGLEEYARMLEQMQVQLPFCRMMRFVLLFCGGKPECLLYLDLRRSPLIVSNCYWWWLPAESSASRGRVVVLLCLLQPCPFVESTGKTHAIRCALFRVESAQPCPRQRISPSTSGNGCRAGVRETSTPPSLKRRYASSPCAANIWIGRA